MGALLQALALRKLAKVFNRIKEPWMLIGSSSLWALGIWERPGDIDILTTKKGIAEIAELLKNNVVKGPMWLETKHGRSYYLLLNLFSVPVEVMADFVFHGEELSERLKFRKKLKKFGLPIYVTPPEVSLASYSRSVRPEDVAKALAIKRWINGRGS